MYQNVSFSTSETITVLPNITILNAPLQTTLLNILCWMYSLGITSDCKSKMGSELHNMLTLKVWLKLVKLGKTCKLFSGIKYMYCRKRHNLVGVGFLKNPSACRHLVLVQNCLCVRPHVSHKVWLLQAFNETFGTKVFFILFFFYTVQHRKTVVVTQYAMALTSDLTGISGKCDDHKAIWNGFEAPNVFHFNLLPMQQITLDANTIRLN